MADTELKETFNINDLTLGELCDLEEVTGLTFGQMDFNKLTGKLALALMWVIGKRENPKFTLEEAKKTKVVALSDFLGK